MLHTFGEIFGFVHHKEGEEGLRELLATVNISREHLADAANELEQAGLTAPAQIIAEAAASALSEFNAGNPYDPTDAINWKTWRQSSDSSAAKSRQAS